MCVFAFDQFFIARMLYPPVTVREVEKDILLMSLVLKAAQSHCVCVCVCVKCAEVVVVVRKRVRLLLWKSIAVDNEARKYRYCQVRLLLPGYYFQCVCTEHNSISVEIWISNAVSELS